MYEEQTYQRRLIPVNIAVMVISLVAALSILFAPLIQLDLGKTLRAVQDVAAETSENQQDGAWGEAQQEAMEIIAEALDGQKLSIGTMEIAKLVFSGDLGAAFAENLAAMMDKLTDELIVHVAIPAIVSGFDAELGETAREVDAEAIYQKFTALETCTPAEKDAVIADLADTIEREFGLSESTGASKEDIKAAISDIYDDTVEKNGGTFTVEACVCIQASQMQAGGDGSGPVYKNYEELMGGMLGAAGGDETGETGEASGPSPLLRSTAFALFFFVGVWLVLFVFAFVHLFLKNKRFMMWYAKLFGGLPCFIFYLVPLHAKDLVLNLEGGAVIANLFGAISSMAWIGGICYLLLWAVSVFWAFPIKRKIRKIRKNGGTA